MPRRLKPGMVFAAVVVAAVVARSIPRPVPLPLEEVDKETLETVDFAALVPAVADFIAQAQMNDTIGRPVSSFPDLWKEAHPGDDVTDRFQWRKFILPMAADLREENDRKVATREGILYWPMPLVRVDTEESKIVRVVVFTQGL